MVIRALSLCLASRCYLVSSWSLANLDALRDAPRCRSRSCTPAGLYISGDAVLARPYLYTITHCCPSDVTVSPSYRSSKTKLPGRQAALLHCLGSPPVFRACLPLSPVNNFHPVFRDSLVTISCIFPNVSAVRLFKNQPFIRILKYLNLDL